MFKFTIILKIVIKSELSIFKSNQSKKANCEILFRKYAVGAKQIAFVQHF